MMSHWKQNGLTLLGKLSAQQLAGWGIGLKIMIFNLIWCTYTTFTPFSHPELYLSTLALTAFLLLLPTVTRSRIVACMLLFLIDGWLVANLMYYRTYYTAIPPSSYAILGNLKDFTQSIYGSLRLYDLLFPLTTLLVGSALWSPKIRPSWGSPFPCLATWVGCLLLLTGWLYPDGGFRKRYKELRVSAYLYASGTPMFTLVGTLYYEWMESQSPDDPIVRSQLTQALQALPPRHQLPDSLPRRSQCVLILAESLESWLLERSVEGQELTPCLNRLLQQPHTIYAPHVLTQVNGGRSIDAQLLMLAGLLPISSGTYSSLYPDHTYPTLVKAMRSLRGTKSYLITGDRRTTWNQAAVAHSFGIDTLLSDTDFTHSAEAFGSRKRIGDQPFVEQCIEKMRQGNIWPVGERAFTLFITYSGHFPFQMPEELKQLHFSTAIPPMMNDYMNVAHYTDVAIGSLVDYLQSRPDYAETLVVITGDHEGLASHRKALCRAEAGKGVISSQPFTPFIVLNAPCAGRHEEVMGQIDIYPTLLSLLGLEHYFWQGLGQSLLDPDKPNAAVSPQMQCVGDTLVERLSRAYSLSDQLIRSDYFKNLDEQPQHILFR